MCEICEQCLNSNAFNMNLLLDLDNSLLNMIFDMNLRYLLIAYVGNAWHLCRSSVWDVEYEDYNDW